MTGKFDWENHQTLTCFAPQISGKYISNYQE